MRVKILRELARRAASDPDFLRQARGDLEGALSRYGYGLTAGELKLVKDLQRRTVGLNDAELARTLSDGLGNRADVSPTRPGAPASSGGGPARPARPGS